MTDARIDLLQGMSIFGAISSENLQLLLERATSVEVPRGSAFFREGEKGMSIFVLEVGRVTVVKRWHDEDYLICSLSAGDFFGEIALLDFMPRSASVIAEEDCRALKLRAVDVLAVARRDMEQFTVIYLNIAREMARRLRDANELLFDARIRYKDVAEDYNFSI
jgi:CRP-like cAMP-binding protein